jgi:hypothetical protein
LAYTTFTRGELRNERGELVGQVREHIAGNGIWHGTQLRSRDYLCCS